MTKITDRLRWTYSSGQELGAFGRIKEFVNLYRAAQDTERGVARYVAVYGEIVGRLKEHLDVQLDGANILDIGPGQKLGLLKCFSTNNSVTGIDTDIIPQGWDISEYISMLRYNSLTRVIKTVARKGLRVDARFDAELTKQLSVPRFGPIPMLRMDATKMSFKDETFDLVCSISVFEHIPKPQEALREVARVLKPGGVAYIAIHLFTCHSGGHIPSMLESSVPQPPYWPHLREGHKDTVQSSAYLNKITLGKWNEMIEEIFPGATVFYERQDSVCEPLAQLKSEGELQTYGDEELLTVNIIAMWQKGNSRSSIEQLTVPVP